MENPYAKYITQQPQGENPYAKYAAAPQNPFTFARDAVESGQVERPTGFNARMNQDYEKRIQQMQKAGETDYTLAEKGLQTLGAGAGYLMDAAGNVVGSGARYIDELAPKLTQPLKQGFQSYAQGASELGQDLGETKAGQFIGRQLIGGQEFLADNPRLTSNVGAAFNIAAAVPIARGAVSAASVVPKEIPIQAAKIAAAPVTGTAKGVKTAALGIKARTGEELLNEAAQLKRGAVQTKAAANLDKFYLSKGESSALINNIDEALSGTKLIPEFTPKTMGVIRTIREEAKNKALTLNDIDQYRRLLGSAKAEDSVAAASVRKALDKTLNQMSEQGRTGESVNLLNQFRKEFTQASKFEDIAEIVDKSKGVPQRLKDGLDRYLKTNPKGWNDKELSLLKRAAKSTVPEKVLRAMGTFGFDFGRVKNVALPTIASGSSALIPGGAVLAGIGTGARQAQKYLARGKAEQLLRTIEQGGKVTMKEIKQLPPREAQQVLKGLSPEMQARVKAAEESLRKGK